MIYFRMKSIISKQIVLEQSIVDMLPEVWIELLDFEGSEIVYSSRLELAVVIESEDGVILNTISIDKKPFSKSLWKVMIDITEKSNRIVIPSTYDTITKHLYKKYGLIYDYENQFYHKGL